jgi:hypothetical protein
VGAQAIFWLCGIVFMLMPLFPLLPGVKVTGPATDWLVFSSIFIGVGLLSIVYGVSTRIITSPQELTTSSVGVSIRISWDNIERIENNQFGVVNLILRRPLSYGCLANWYLRLMGLDRLVQISPFVDDWQTSELAKDIQAYAPHATIPPELLNQPVTPAFYRISIILMYYLLSLLLLGPIMALLRSLVEETVGIPVAPLGMGAIGALVAGASSLFVYSGIARDYSDIRQLRRPVILLYLQPAIGISIGIVAGSILWFILDQIGYDAGALLRKSNSIPNLLI